MPHLSKGAQVRRSDLNWNLYRLLELTPFEWSHAARESFDSLRYLILLFLFSVQGYTAHEGKLFCKLHILEIYKPEASLAYEQALECEIF